MENVEELIQTNIADRKKVEEKLEKAQTKVDSDNAEKSEQKAEKAKDDAELKDLEK